MGSKIALKNAQDQEFSINHLDNAGAIAINSNDISTKSQIETTIAPYNKGFKNYIINGKKRINQRGLTSTDNSYNQDRWYKAGNNWYQGIEGDNNLINGKTYTLSWVGTATASYYVGTATSATINSQTFTTIANGGSFTLTISTGQNLWVKFSSDSTGSTFNYVQLEEGSVATPFEQRPYGLELSLCQRYYQIIRQRIVQSQAAGGYTSISTTLPVPMRIAPIVTEHQVLNSINVAANTIAVSDTYNFSRQVIASGGAAVTDSDIIYRLSAEL